MRRPLFIVLFCTVILGGFAQENADWYQDKPIRNIIFEGLNNVRSSDLAGLTEPFIGRLFTDDIYWDLFGRLFALEYFETISTTVIRADAQGNEVVIRFTVTERPVVGRINYSGNSGIRRNALNNAVSLKPNDILTGEKLRLDELALTNLYLSRGYPGVRVRSETAPAASGSMNVTFYIEEGEKITIEAFIFEGNTVFNSRRLQRLLSLRTKGLLSDGAFQEAGFIADQQALIQFYRDRGYLDAVIVDASRDVQTDERGNNNMTITYRIYEGRMYTFGGITFEGNLLFSTEQLSGMVFSRVGEPVNDRRLQADLLRIVDLYLENGYIFNRFDPIPDQDAETGILSFNMIITERGRAHIENIIVTGNVKTKDEVILREIPLESGDVFSKAKIMDGLRNLYNLQFFSQVIPDTPPGSVDALMDLIISVEEQPTTDVQFGITFSGTADPDTFPISGMFGWTDRNFLGRGNIAGAEVNANQDSQTLSLQYTQRWIFGSPLSGSFDFNLQHSKRRTAMKKMPPFFEDDDVYAYPDGFGSWEDYRDSNWVIPDEYLMPYNQWSFSIGASTGYRWPTVLGNLTVSGGLRFGMLNNIYDADIYRPFDPVLRNDNNKWTPSTSLWTSIALDQRNIFYDPSRGYYAIQRFGYYGVLGNEQEYYVRSDTKAEWFITLFSIPVSESWSFTSILGLHSGLSFILPHSAKRGPIIEEANRLAVDGMFNGRGWASEYRNKGNALWENWVELRFPLIQGILAWDFFFDAAGVKKTPHDFFTDFTGEDDLGYSFMRYSLGGGFRFTIPQFPLRFSLAKRFWYNKRTGKVEWADRDTGLGGMDFVISFSMSTY